MPFTKEQLLVEAQRRGLQVPSQQVSPKFTKEQLLAEAQRRGFQSPPTAPKPKNGRAAAFDGIDEFQDTYQPQVPGGSAPPADVPYDESLQPIPPTTEPTFGEKAVGVGEAGLALATGATGGLVGSIGGFIKGINDAVAKGKLGTQEGVNIVEKATAKLAEQFTYSPQTEAGQEYTRDVGEILTPLQALGPVQAPRFPVKAAAPGKPAVKPDISKQVKNAAEAGIGSKAKQELLSQQIDHNPDVVASAKRLGVEEYLQPDHITTNQQYREIAQLVKSVPGSEARQVELTGLAQIAKRADAVIDEIGGTSDWSTLSSDVKTRMQANQTQLFKKADELYSQLGESIPAKTEVETNNITSWIKGQAEELGGIKNLSPIEKQVLSRMTAKDGKPVSYALLDRTRKDLTAARVKKEGVFKDADTGLIKKLEKELLKDQQKVAEDHGVSGVFDDARKVVAIRKSLENDLTSLFGKQLDGSFITPLQTGIKKIPSGDVTKFKKTIDSIPEEMRSNVVATAMETAFGKTARRGEMSFNTYANWYENALKNKDAFNEVMKHLPEGSKKVFNDLYQVSNGIRKSTNEYIATGRGESLRASLENVDSLMSRIVSKTVTPVISGAADLAGMSGAATALIVKGAISGPKTKGILAIDKMIASPQFRNMVNERVKTGTSKLSTVRQLTRSKQFKNYISDTGLAIANPEIWILEGMSASIEND